MAEKEGYRIESMRGMGRERPGGKEVGSTGAGSKKLGAGRVLLTHYPEVTE